MRFSFPLSQSQLLQRFHLKKIAYIVVPTGGFLFYYQYYHKKHIEILYNNTPFNEELIPKLTTLQKGFRPSLLLPSAFHQIVYAAKIEPFLYKDKINFTRELFQLSDGGAVALDWLNKEKGNQQVIIMTHGLTGGTDSIYMMKAAKELAEKGFTVVCFNQRGVSKTPLLTPKYHCHGEYSDLQTVIQHLKQQYKEIYGVGISIGANLLLKYAGNTKNECGLNAIVSIANPFNLNKCSDNIMSWDNYLYNVNITENFKTLLAQHMHILQQIESISDSIHKAQKAKTTYEFDENFTRRIHNFKNVRELYDFISCENFIKDISIPVLCINSKDDPIAPYSCIPIDKIKKNQNIILAITQRGGHVEWFEGLIPQRWIMNPVSQFLKVLTTSDAEIVKESEYKQNYQVQQ